MLQKLRSSRLLRLSMRFILPLAAVIGLFAYAVVPLVDDLTLHWFVKDLDIRSQSLANTMHDPLAEYVPKDAREKMAQLFDRAIRDERLYAIAFCNPAGELVYQTQTYPKSLGCRRPLSEAKALTSLLKLPEGLLHVSESTLEGETGQLGRLILVHDMSYIERRSADMRKYIISLFSLMALVISLITVVVAHLSWRGWIKAVKSMLRGERNPAIQAATEAEIQPLVGDLHAMLREFNLERRVLGNASQTWTPDKLRSLLHDELAGDEILVVSNREPYLHVHTDKGIAVHRPASGLVTAVEPVMRACSGTWIAHGSGTADRETVDRQDRVAVPPEQPSYTLRRIWLTQEEEQGYYYGFANEGMWPLCHIAHVRPVFRANDWEYYEAINRRFANAVIAEARTDNPVVLVQDYHFALVPRMVREALPKATIITFWHIPWPNPESFGICPWREEILEGLLGSTILGFHTPFHCKNFLETVDRYLETRIEHEASTISYGGELTQVESYPISIAWPEPALPTEVKVDGHSSIDLTTNIEACRRAVRQECNLPSNQLMAIGVDRLDYTKGIIERFDAVGRMLELHPNMVGKFTLVQIAAPSRSSLEEYKSLEIRVRDLAQQINGRYPDAAGPPILLKIEQHGADQVNRYYRASDVCMVTSLHDGMNLVAKEFIAAREDELGVLVLSQFTGAARELHEALIINPYHIEQSAGALYRAITMPVLEQRERMRSMRSLVRDFNVFRWAGRMLLDAARLRRRERIMTKIRSHSKPNLKKAASS
jgi:trehalose-6-phosphate synthase